MESNESNNTAVSAAAIQLTFPPLPDLKVESLTFVESELVSGGPLTVQWQTVNDGTIPAIDSFHERLVVRNVTIGQTLLNTIIDFKVPANDPIEAGESLARQRSFTLPVGAAGAGTINISVTTDVNNEMVESFAGNLPESNNIWSITTSSSLRPYPDLVVGNLSATPSSLKTGETVALA